MARALVVAAVACAASARARADELPGSIPGPPLGGYERDALAQVLQARGLSIDPAPEGKRVAAIFVTNLDVFGRDDGVLQWLNVFHRTTREHVIEREVLLRPGDLWDAEIAAESRRRLTDPTLSSLVVIVPVRAADPTKVNLLVVTRDIWSLRLNSDFEYQAGVLSLLKLQPSENNLFGWRKTFIAVFDMDLGRYAIGPTYIDPNIAGTRWTLNAGARALFGRNTNAAEGSSSSIALAHPLWSFRRKWGGEASFSHFVGTVRSFYGTSLRPIGVPGALPPPFAPEGSAPEPGAIVPYHYRTRSYAAGLSVTRSFGERLLHRVSLGYQYKLLRASTFAEDFVGLSPQIERAFVRAWLPRSERWSAVGVTYRLQTTTYFVLRDVDTFDLPEDTNVGPQAMLSLFRALGVLGSEHDFWLVSGWAGWSLVGRDSLAQLFGGGETRLEAAEAIDNRWWADGKLAAPRLGPLRLVARGQVDRVVDNQVVRALVLGGDNGLRGYPIGFFIGQAWYRVNAELRTGGLRAWSTRLGLVAFWDAGDAAPSFAQLQLYQDFGAGFRLLLPQLQRAVIRFDWAFATRGPTAGVPGRLTAGFTQAF